MKRRRSIRPRARAHIKPSNRHTILLFICILTGRDFLILAVAAAASPVKSIPKSRWSLPLIPWESSSFASCDNHHPSKSFGRIYNSFSRWIRTSLPNHATCYPISISLLKSLAVRGGESNNNDDLDLSDIDDDVTAEDLLDAIFDDHNESNTTPNKGKKSDRKKRRPLKTSINQKLQESIKKKSTPINDESLGVDALTGFDFREKSISPIIPLNARNSSKQQKTMNIRRSPAPKLEPRGRAGASTSSTPSTTSKSSSDRSINDTFRNELDRLSKQPSPLSRSRTSSEGSRKEGLADEKDLRRRSSSYSLGDDSYMSGMRNGEKYETINKASRDQVVNYASRREASPETSSLQQIRAAPTVSTSGISRPPSPTFVRRRSPATSTETNSPTSSRHHAVWGPHVQHRRSKPGPLPTKATEDERRAHETQSRIRQERKKLLSNLAIRMNDSHTAAIKALIRGSAAHIPPELFGQTIMQEKSACNEKFYGSVTEVQSSLGVRDSMDRTVLGEEIDAVPSFRHIEDTTLLSYWGLTPHAKLYGGAQYHRVLRYYHHMFLTVPLPPITDDEVALLTNGITEVHDASDLMRAVALLVRQKMEIVMEDVLADMTRRLLYVMDRQWEMVEYSMALHRPMGGANGLGKSGDKVISEAELLNRHGIEFHAAESGLKNILSASFHNFARERAEHAHRQSLEDIRSLLRYVTWDMGRARKRVLNQGQSNQGFVSQIEIVGREHIQDSSKSAKEDTKTKRQSKKKAKSARRKPDKTQSISGSSDRIMARGGGAVGSGRKRSRRLNEKENGRNQGLQKDGNDVLTLYDENEQEDDMGDLIGGVMNRGKPNDSDDENNATGNQSMLISSQSSPLFSGDDEVLSVLLATVSSTLAPKSDVQAGHTQAAIENLVSYVTDRMRMDMSRIIRSKFNTFFLLAFHESLGSYLSKELNAYLTSLE